MKLLLILVIASLISLSIGCDCIFPTIEKNFCDSEFSIKIKVKSEIHPTEDLFNSWYEIEVLEVYKSDEKTRTALNSNRIWTAQQSATCGRVFESNQIYIITGSVDQSGTKARTHSCTFGKNIKDLSETEKQFFEKDYKSVSCSKSS
jgi:hypothetical protein